MTSSAGTPRKADAGDELLAARDLGGEIHAGEDDLEGFLDGLGGRVPLAIAPGVVVTTAVIVGVCPQHEQKISFHHGESPTGGSTCQHLK